MAEPHISRRVEHQPGHLRTKETGSSLVPLGSKERREKTEKMEGEGQKRKKIPSEEAQAEESASEEAQAEKGTSGEGEEDHTIPR